MMDHGAIAAEICEALAERRQIAPLHERLADFTLADAYAVAAALRRFREAGGERHVGRKIGFTNSAIWDEYGVHAPIWGDMTCAMDAPRARSRIRPDASTM